MAFINFIIWLVTVPIMTGRLRGSIRSRMKSFFMALPARRKCKRIGRNFRCGGGGKVHLTRKTEIGDNVALQGVWASGNGRLRFGNCIACGDSLRIFTRNHNYEGDRLPFDSKWVTKDVFVDDYVWIGAQVILLPGTHIHEGAIIQAGSVVHGDVPACAIAGGNPAKVFAYRDRERFERLKAGYEAARLGDKG